MSDQSLYKKIVIFIYWFRPRYFCERGHSWEDHVLHLRKCGNVFCPHICLHAHDVFLFVSRKRFRNRIVAVYFFKRKKSSNGKRLMRTLRLVMIEITISTRAHYHIVFCLCCSNSTVFTAPRHYCSAIC